MKQKLLGSSATFGGLAYLMKWFFSEAPASEPVPELLLHLVGIGVALGLLVVGGYFLMGKHA